MEKRAVLQMFERQMKDVDKWRELREFGEILTESPQGRRSRAAEILATLMGGRVSDLNVRVLELDMRGTDREH